MKFGNKKIAILSIFTGLSFIIFGGVVNFAYAVDNSSYIPLAPLPRTIDDKGQVNLNTYIPGIFNLAIGIAGVLAVLMIVIGGVEYMTTDAIGGKTEGKERINNALWGLLLVLVSWILLHTINPRLTIFDLNVADQKIVANKDVVDIEYVGTGLELDNRESHDTQSVVGRDGRTYTASVTKTTYTHEGDGKSYKEVEVYMDNKYDTYQTTKNTDVKGVVTMEWRVERFNGEVAYFDKDGNVIKTQ